MKIVVDLDLHEAIQDFTIVQPAGVYDFKSQDTIDFWIYFVRQGGVQDFGAGFAIKFGMIATGDTSNTLLAYQTVTSHQTDTDGNVYYLCQVNFNTSQMASAIAGKTQLPCTAEIRYQTADAEIIHSLNISTLVFPTILAEAGTTPPSVPPTYPDASTLELIVHKNQPSGYAGLDSSGHIYPAQFAGVAEVQANKDQPSGYAGLDAGALLHTAEMPIDNSTIIVDPTSGKLTAPFVGGDMKKSTYDTNADGVIDHAALADSATTATNATTAATLSTATALGPLNKVWGKDASNNQGLFTPPASLMTIPDADIMQKSVYVIGTGATNTNEVDHALAADALKTDSGAGTTAAQVWGKDASGKQALYPAPTGGGGGGGIPEAPTDGKTYGRKNSAWSPATVAPLTDDVADGAPSPTGCSSLISDPNNGVLKTFNYDGGWSDDGHQINLNATTASDAFSPSPPSGSVSLINDGTGIYLKKVKSSDGSLTVVDNSSWIDLQAPGSNRLGQVEIFDDFEGYIGSAAPFGRLGWQVVQDNGTGATIANSAPSVNNDEIGAWLFGSQTGTGSSTLQGRLCIGAPTNSGSIIMNPNGKGQTTIEWRVKIATSHTTTDYAEWRFGVNCASSPAFPQGVTDAGMGLFFKFNRNLSANWICCYCPTGSTAISTFTSSVAADPGLGTPQRLTMVIGTAGSTFTPCAFYINGTLVTSQAININSGGSSWNPMATVGLRAGSGPHQFKLDWFYAKYPSGRT